MTLSTAVPMAAAESRLEIQLFFASGESASYVQDDPAVIAALLQHLPSPARLFAQAHLTLAGDHSLSLIPTAAVTRLDIRTAAALPTWPFLGGAESVQDVPEAVYRRRFDPETYAAARAAAAARPGTPQNGFTEIDLTGGQRLFWEVEMPSRPMISMDIARVGTSLLNADALHARLQSDDPARSNGIMVVNPAHIQCLTFFPGPPQVPPHAWNLRRV